MQNLGETNDLGFDFLMSKPKKSSDNISISSSSRKSSRHETNFVDIKEHLDNKSEMSYDVASSTDDDDGESVQSSEISYHSKQHKKQQKQKAYARSESESSSSYASASVKSGNTNVRRGPSEEDILNEKKEMLYQFDRLEKKGVRMPRKYNMSSSLEEMKAEFERLKRDREVDASIKFQRRMVMAFASGVEYLNDKFDPFDVKLSGWSEKVHEDIDDYDDVFEELHQKYKSKAKMAPEIKLVFMMGSSAFMFHLTNSMFSKSMPGLDTVLKQNPELMKQFAAATANTMAQEQKKQGNSPLGGLVGMLGSFFGGSAPQGQQQMHAPSSPPLQQQQTRMKGPSNIDDIMNELNDNDRLEMMSTVTESELFDLPDDASINGILNTSKKTSKAPKKSKNSVSLEF